MESEIWSMALPVGGLPLKKLSVIGSGKDLEMRILRDERLSLVLPLDGVRSTVTEDVVLKVSRVDDVSLELSYEAPELVLSRLHVHWDEDSMPGIKEELGALFEGATKGATGRRELAACVDVEFELTTRNTEPESLT